MALSKPRFIWDNRKLDAATLAASSAATGYPAKALQDRLRARRWRTTGLGEQTLTIDMGQPVLCSCVALVDPNLTEDGTIQLLASEYADFSDPVLDESWEAAHPAIGMGEGGYGLEGYGGRLSDAERRYFLDRSLWVQYFDAPAEARYWQIIINDAANPDGYYEAGRLYLCSHYEFDRRVSYGWGLSGADDSEISFSKGGQAWTTRQPLRRVLTLSWPAFKKDDKYWGLWWPLKILGRSQDFIMDVLPDAQASERMYTLLYGRLQNVPESTADNLGSDVIELTVEESL